MRTRRHVHRLLSAFVIAGLLLGPLAPLAHAQDGTRFFPLIQQPVSSNLSTTDLVFRTRVQVRTAAQWRDLERMQPVFLDRGDDWAWLLVDDAHLADLARLRYGPSQTNGLGTLLAAHDGGEAAAFEPLLAQAQLLAARVAAADSDMQAADAARADLRAGLHALAAGQRAFLAAAATVDSDADGATDDQEAWWCTDPAKADTDSDGTKDGAEIDALKAWVGNNTPDALRAGPPSTGKPFQGWPPQKVGCYDDDQDSVPDMAEQLELGLYSNRESTDRDKFDDGQELFGHTYCTGQGGFCSYGPLPRNEDWGVIFAEMPSWVRAPGNHPLVAAFPVPEVDVVPSSLKVETVTVITTDKTISQGTEKSYSTAKTEGASTSVADTETWNSWQESFESREEIATGASVASSVGYDLYSTRLESATVVEGRQRLDEECKELSFTQGSSDSLGGGIEAGIPVAPVPVKVHGEYSHEWQRSQTTSANQVLTDRKCKAALASFCEIAGSNDPYCTPEISDIRLTEDSKLTVKLADIDSLVGGLAGVQLAQLQSGQLIGLRLQEIGYALTAPRVTTGSRTGYSTGGARTTTTEAYEEFTVTNGEAFSTIESWGMAVAVDSAHAADFWFTYKVRNSGTEYAREIAGLVFNLYIGDDPNPAYTYFVAPDIGGSGKFQNFMPTTEHTYTSRRIPLSLEQMKAIDLGEPVRIVVEDFTYGIDELFYQDAANAGVLIALEDGSEDGDETIDSYLIPTWGAETVLTVLGRYFPHETDANGTLTAIWTPEMNRNDTPSWCVEPKRPSDQPTKALWCKHELSVADWWNVYTDGLGDGSQGFQDTPAVPGAVALFRFNQDTDHDGFSDRSEARLGTDPKDASSFPFPEVLAGVHSIRSGDQVRATLSLLNTGFYDAYGVEAVMVAPDDSVSITNNTVGGSGRVRAQQQVIVGSRVLPSPLLAPWSQEGHAVPAAGGYYTGSSDRTYTFIVANCPAGGCQVGSGAWTLNWNDGAGGSGSLNFGDGYASPTFLPVSNGVTLALYSGGVQYDEGFILSAQTPRDTFQYTIKREPYTAPLVVVSYNDPQGNHRFVVPSQAMTLTNPTDNLQVFARQMLDDVGVEVVSHAPFAPGSNTVDLLVNNPSNTALTGAHLFLEIVNISGTVVSEVSTQVDVPPGPKSVAMTFSTGSFDPPYVAEDDYILLAFLTDYQGNILDTGGRPLSSLQADPLPKLESAALEWDFSKVPQGTLLRKPLALANTGSGRLYTYLPSVPGLSLVRHSGTVGAADLSDYSLLLRTSELPVGPFDQTLTLRTSDPDQPTLQVRVHGMISAPTADTAGGPLRPLDVPVTVTGPKSQGEWVEFTHNLGPEPQSLHPVKVYSSDYATMYGAGKYSTAFSEGTASYDMFGDGRDGDLVVASGQTVTINSVRVSVSASGTAASPASSNGFTVGDLVMFHQTQGTTNVGKWELATIATINSPTSWILTRPLSHSYDTGGGRAQVIKVPQYRNVSIQGGATLSTAAWDGNTGGILAFLANGIVTVDGIVTVTAKGYRGAARVNSINNGLQGEGVTGPGGTASYLANGNGGGGGVANAVGSAGGGGGGNSTEGGGASASGTWGSNHTQGGQIAGSSDSAVLILGGGGGSGGAGQAGGSGSGMGGAGAAGGGLIYIAGTTVLVHDSTGAIVSSGQTGGAGTGTGNASGGGGGAGGIVLIRVQKGTLATIRVTAIGGVGGSRGTDGPHGSASNGGAGGQGRIHIEYCESLSGTTNPPAGTQKLTCYITEQVESSPYTTGWLNLPENVTGSSTYQVQYGRKLDFAAAGEQTTTLRLPAGMLAAASLDLLVSGVGSGDLTLRLDIGGDGSWEWEQTQAVTDAATFPVTGLAAAFNAYWQTQGAPVSGSLDVPVKVSLSKPGQALLTNLQVHTAGSKLRYARLPIQVYSSFNLALQVGGSGSMPLTVAVDIGDDGTLDWSDARTADLPLRLLTGDLSAALNAYLDDYRNPSDYGDEHDVPIRIHVAPDQAVALLDYTATMVPAVDLLAQTPLVSGPALAVQTAASPSYQEGETLHVQAIVQNTGSRNSGPVTVAFFATAAGWGDWYIGSDFVADLLPSGSAQVGTSWETLGFAGETLVKAVINPYGRTGETSLTNNTGSVTVNIVPLAQPPTAAFSATPTSGTVGLNVQFTDASTSPLPITSWLWDFGDGATSTQQNPQHIYNQAGVYTVKLTVANASGSDDETKTGYITVTASPTGVVADFSAAPTSGIAPLGVVFQDLSSGPVSAWAWEFGDGGTSSQRNPMHTYSAPGAYTVKLTVSGASGSNSKTRQGYITVNPKQSQTISFAAILNRRLGEPPFTLSATASSGLPVSFVGSTPAVCALSGSTVTLLDVGVCTVVATQTGNANYHPAPPVARSFMVNTPDEPDKQNQFITFDELLDRNLEDSPFSVTASASSGLPVSFYTTTPEVCSVNGGMVTLLAVGECTIVAVQGGNSAYNPAAQVEHTFSITQGKQSQAITFAPLRNRGLDESPFDVQATASSGLPVSFRSETPTVCTVNGRTVTLLDVGECSISASQSGNAGYLPAAAVTRSFSVLPEGERPAHRVYLPGIMQ